MLVYGTKQRLSEETLLFSVITDSVTKFECE